MLNVLGHALTGLNDLGFTGVSADAWNAPVLAWRAVLRSQAAQVEAAARAVTTFPYLAALRRGDPLPEPVGTVARESLVLRIVALQAEVIRLNRMLDRARRWLVGVIEYDPSEVREREITFEQIISDAREQL